MFHKVTFQGLLPPPGLGSHADSAELSGPCVCWEERRENEGWNGRGAPIPGETGLRVVLPLRQSRQAAHSFPGRRPSLGGIPSPCAAAVGQRGRRVRGGAGGALNPGFSLSYSSRKLCAHALYSV